MARTEQGSTLTEQHRRAQLQIRAQALRDFTRIWPLWQPGELDSFPHLVTATLPLVRAYHRLASTVAASYYTAFREAERVPGVSPPRIADPVPDAKITTSLYVTGKLTWEKARRTGRDARDAREAALTNTSGAVTRHVLAGARDTIVRSSVADPLARGWARVTDADPCAFCALLAGRGPVYKSHDTADFEAHDHCGCSAEPVYAGAAWPGRAREFHDLYNRATREAAAAGELDRGTSNDLLNAFRRAYEHQRAGQAGA